MREKHGLKRKALVIDTKDGLLIKPVPEPEEEMGSLRGLFKKSAKELKARLLIGDDTEFEGLNIDTVRI